MLTILVIQGSILLGRLAMGKSGSGGLRMTVSVLMVAIFALSCGALWEQGHHWFALVCGICAVVSVFGISSAE
jgi:uncharacterized membrane protein YgaE (UPF0421/DUF939 family)